MEIRGNRPDTYGMPDAKNSAKPKGSGAEQPSYRQQLLEIMEKMEENVKNGTVQPKIPTGAQAYTVKEWDKLLEKFDAAQETIQEEVKARAEQLQAEAEKKALEKKAMSEEEDNQEEL